MKVTPSKTCESRLWWCNVAHLKGQRMEVKNIEGEYITFIAEKGKTRCWHQSNLRIINIVLENK